MNGGFNYYKIFIYIHSEYNALPLQKPDLKFI